MFCFTYFTDRDGKYQLKSLAESGFDPLSRTCRFMLTEEAHHMFVGETGLGRVVKRTLEVMKELGTDDPARIRAHGAVDLPLLQKYLNFWCSSSLDLFGSEISSNSAANFANGLKGRPDEGAATRIMFCAASTFKLSTPEGERGSSHAERAERSDARVLPEGLRDRPEALEPRHRARRPRGAGAQAAVDALPPLDRRLGRASRSTPRAVLREKRLRQRTWTSWIPSAADRAFVQSLMQRVVEPGKMAGWVAPPDRGINNLPVEYEYVKLH